MESLTKANQQLEQAQREGESLLMKKEAEIVELQSKHFAELSKKMDELAGNEAKLDLAGKERDAARQRVEELSEEVKTLRERQIKLADSSEVDQKLQRAEAKASKLREEIT